MRPFDAEVRKIVENALRHFDGNRYALDEFAVASNHVHVLVTPLGEHDLSEILHSWKSFTAHEILKVRAASRRLSAAHLARVPVTYKAPKAAKVADVAKVAAASRREGNHDRAETALHRCRKRASKHTKSHLKAWSKFRDYIRAHNKVDEASRLVISEELRRDAAATLIAEACSPFDKPEVRDTLVRVKRESEQTINVTTIDTVLESGFDAVAKDKAEETVRSFRDYIAEHRRARSTRSRSFTAAHKQRLTEPMLKELEKKLREVHAAWTEDRLWDAFAVTAPGKVKGRSQAGRFADLVALVRFALEQQPVLVPSPIPSPSVSTMAHGQSQSRNRLHAGATGLANLMRDQIATSLSIEPDDLDLSPFNQRGGLGKAHQLFGEQLPKLLDELNEALAA